MSLPTYYSKASFFYSVMLLSHWRQMTKKGGLYIFSSNKLLIQKCLYNLYLFGHRIKKEYHSMTAWQFSTRWSADLLSINFCVFIWVWKVTKFIFLQTNHLFFLLSTPPVHDCTNILAENSSDLHTHFYLILRMNLVFFHFICDWW